MAYTVPAGSIAEFQLRYLLAGQQCINTFHYRLDGTLTNGGLGMEDLLAQWEVNVGQQLLAFLTSDCTNVRARGQWVYPTRFVSQEITVDAGVGTATPPTESVGTAVVLRKLTDRAARTARGRIYLGGVAQTAVDIGTLTAGFYNSLNVVWSGVATLSFTDTNENRTIEPVVWSYQDPGNHDFITRGTVDQYVRYQRRREVGRGI